MRRLKIRKQMCLCLILCGFCFWTFSCGKKEEATDTALTADMTETIETIPWEQNGDLTGTENVREGETETESTSVISTEESSETANSAGDDTTWEAVTENLTEPVTVTETVPVTEEAEDSIWWEDSNLIQSDGAGTTCPELADPQMSVVETNDALYTYDRMVSDLNTLAAAYPQLIQLDIMGYTADGRALYVCYVGNRNADRQIVIVAATHAREYMTTQLVMKQIEEACVYFNSGTYENITYSSILNRTCFCVMPMVNPDGVTISQLGTEGLWTDTLKASVEGIYASDLGLGLGDTDYATYLKRWKANARGVDLNRNYSPGWESVTDRSQPSSSLYKGTEAGSEAESQAQMQLVNSLSNPVLVISYHSYGSLVYWQYGQEEPLWTANAELAQRISDLTGYYTAGYSNEAGFSNWCVNVKGIPSVTVETGSLPCPLPIEQFGELWTSNRNMWWMLGTSY